VGYGGQPPLRTSLSTVLVPCAPLSSPDARSPGDFGRADLPVGYTREREEKVGKPVQVDDDYLRQVLIAAKAHDRPLSPPADSARDVKCGRLWASRRGG
jgi:hypothetical protein